MTDVVEQKSSNTLGTVAFVLSIVGLVLCLLIFGLPFGIFFLVIALILGLIALGKKPRGKAVTSILISLITLGGLTFAGIWFGGKMVAPIQEFANWVQQESQTDTEFRLVFKQPGFSNFLEYRMEVRMNAMDWASFPFNKGIEEMTRALFEEIKAEMTDSVQAWIAQYGLPTEGMDSLGADETFYPGMHEWRLDDDMLVGGDRDEYGCIGSAGYLWDEEAQACVRPWETETTPLTPEQIEALIGEEVRAEIINEVDAMLNS